MPTAQGGRASQRSIAFYPVRLFLTLNIMVVAKLSNPMTQQIQSLQALRFFAAFIVVVTHSTFYAHNRLEETFPIWATGTFGVNIFFVISGFVMFRTAQSRAGAERGWADFGLRRVIRIIPLYWLVTSIKLVTVLAAPALALNSQFDFGHLFASYFLIPTVNANGDFEPLLGVGWTLIYEVFFYALCCISLFARVSVFYFSLTVLCILTALSPLVTESWPPIQMYFNPIVLDFLLGMIIAKFLIFRSLPLWTSVMFICVGIAWLLAVEAFAPSLGTFFSRGLPAFLIVAGVVSLEKWTLGRWPNWLLTLGGASYALYLCHPIVAPLAPEVLRRLGLINPAVSVLASVSISIGISVIVHLAVEMPLFRALNKYVNKWFKSSKSDKPTHGLSTAIAPAKQEF